MQSIILKPVAFCLQNKMRKQSDLKSPFDKAWKDYHDSYSELEKNERKDAKKLGKVIPLLRMTISSHPYSMATIPHKIKAKIMTWTKHRSSILCGQLNAWLGVNRCEHFKILKKGQCFRLFSTLKNIKICLIWRMFTFLKNVNIRQIKQIFIFFNVENSRKHCPFLVFFKILKCSHLNAPVMHSADHTKIEDLGLKALFPKKAPSKISNFNRVSN